MQKTFDVVWKTVNDKYFDPGFGGVNWAAIRKQYEPQIASVRDDEEFRELLDRMLNEIKISHLRILDLKNLDKLLARAVVTRGLALRDLDNQVVVSRIVDGSPAATAGLRAGFIVKAIDGVPVLKARSSEAQVATDKKKHRLLIVDAAETTREIEIGYALPPVEKLESVSLIKATRYVLVETKNLDDGIGYIHFTNFIAPMKKRLLSAFDSLRNSEGMIIDLRGNSGGETEAGLALAGMLIDKEAQISMTQTRQGDGQRYKAKPLKKPYLGPVVILLDEESASESEELTAGLQASGRVVVIGRRSRGEDMDATFQELPMDSIALLYPVGLPRTPNGITIEGRGVIPDIDVRLTRAELLEGKDSQLQAAVRHIRGLTRQTAH
jgi:carboxyl-terminal processing protease